MKFYLIVTLSVVLFVTKATFTTSTFLISPDTFFDKYVIPFYKDADRYEIYTEGLDTE